MATPEKKYTVSINFAISARKFWRVYLPAAIGVSIAAMAAAIFFVDGLIMPGIVGMARGTVMVPAVQGLTLEQGREKFFEAGLLTEIKSREYNESVPQDAIVSQSPEPGARVKKGRRILVVVSKGREQGIVPDVKEMTERQARTELRKNGFAEGNVKKVFNENVATEKVVDAEPSCGSTVSRDTKVDLIVSKGPKPTQAEMPNIVGEPIAEARKNIEVSGLKVGTISYRPDPSLTSGTVVAQSIAPGDKVPLETTVDVTVTAVQ